MSAEVVAGLFAFAGALLAEKMGASLAKQHSPYLLAIGAVSFNGLAETNTSLENLRGAICGAGAM